MTEENSALGWRNSVVQWHLDQQVPLSCGCDEDTPDDEYCSVSVEYADRLFVSQPDELLEGDPDKWNHDVWFAAWERNLPLIASGNDYRLPKAPAGMAWLATRILVNGRKAIDLALLRIGEHKMKTVCRGRVDADPTLVAIHARRMLQEIKD